MNRSAEVRACVESLLGESERLVAEVIVVLNGATDAVRAEVTRLAAGDARVRTLDLPFGSASVARNRAVEASQGEILYFIDDDAVVAPGTVPAIHRCFAEHDDVGIVGGPNLTPPDDPAFAHLTGALLATAWGTGVTRARYGHRAEGPADERHLILCNLAIRHELFSARGLAFPALFGGEENALMGHADAKGVRGWYAPTVVVHHRRRATLAGYCEQVHRYGWGRANALATAPGTFRLAYFVPVGLLLYLVARPWLAALSTAALIPLALYGLGTLGASLRLGLHQRRPSWVLGALPLYPITHLVYAAGLSRRGLRLCLDRATGPARVEHPR